MKAILSYAAVAASILVVGAGVVSWLVAAADPSSVWLAALIAWPVQLIAFWILLRRKAPGRFMVGWAGGMALRFATVAGVAIWSTRTETFDAATVLVSLVGFVFVLVLLEPLFLRLAD